MHDTRPQLLFVLSLAILLGLQYSAKALPITGTFNVELSERNAEEWTGMFTAEAGVVTEFMVSIGTCHRDPSDCNFSYLEFIGLSWDGTFLTGLVGTYPLLGDGFLEFSCGDCGGPFGWHSFNNADWPNAHSGIYHVNAKMVLPEPTSFMLMLIALGVIATFSLRRRSRQAPTVPLLASLAGHTRENSLSCPSTHFLFRFAHGSLGFARVHKYKTERLMFVPRLAALIVAFCLALPSAAEASLIWSIEVSSTHLSGTGQIAFSGPSSTTSPDFLFDFSGKYSNNTWSLTEDDVTATWEVDSNWILTSLDLDSGLFETDSPGVTATFSLVGSIDQFFAESFCFDSVSFRCHEDSFDVDQTENVVLTALHEIPEPRAYWLFILGLSLLAFVWIRADKSSRRGFLASKHQY